MISALLMAVVAAGPLVPVKLATIDWVVTRVDPSLASFYAQALAQALREQGLEVVTPQELSVLIGRERQQQLLGCNTDSDCLAELSNAVGCDATLVVNLTRLDGTLTATLKVLSARDGRVMVEARAESDSEKGLHARLDDAALELADRLLPGHAEDRRRGRALIPLVLGGAMVAVGTGALAFSLHQRDLVNGELSRARQVTPAAVDAASLGKTTQLAGWLAACGGVAAMGVGAVMLLTSRQPPPVNLTALVGPGTAYVGLAGTWP